MSTKQHAEKANSKQTSKAVSNKSDTLVKSNTSKSASKSTVSSTPNDPKTQAKCIAEGCQKLAIAHSEWDNEYCSIRCCYDHCKFTFNAWLENNKKTKAKTDTVSSVVST